MIVATLRLVAGPLPTSLKLLWDAVVQSEMRTWRLLLRVRLAQRQADDGVETELACGAPNLRLGRYRARGWPVAGLPAPLARYRFRTGMLLAASLQSLQAVRRDPCTRAGPLNDERKALHILEQRTQGRQRRARQWAQCWGRRGVGVHQTLLTAARLARCMALRRVTGLGWIDITLCRSALLVSPPRCPLHRCYYSPH